MCKCTPEIRTPFCGKSGCEIPKQEGVKSEREGAKSDPPCPYCGRSDHIILLHNGNNECFLDGCIFDQEGNVIRNGFYACF